MDSLSRISSLVETARDLTLEAARDAANARRSTTRPVAPQALKKLLDSRREVEVLDGLRRVISMFYSNQPVLPYFTAVVKNIASPNMEIKKLVYAFLIQHAEAAPDTALLSINTIQKGLSDSNPQTRALALRTMSSIRVPVISQIVALGIKRGTGDMSPIVRKTAALAIPKCYTLDPTHAALLEDQLAILLGDRQYYVAGAAVHAFLEVCPNRMDMIHPHWRSLVKKLVDMDEWGQLSTLELMLRYSRMCFSRKTRQVQKSSQRQNASMDSYGETASLSTESAEQFEQTPILQQDLELFLNAAQPLLQSRNSAVVMATSRCYLYLGTADHVRQLVGPLMSTLRAAPDISSLALSTIADIVRQYPEVFVPWAMSFLLRAYDTPTMVESKLGILSLLFPLVTPALQTLILTDLSHHTHSGSSAVLTRASMLAIGRCASTAPTSALRSRCLQLLLTQISSPDATLVAACLDEIRVLIQRDPAAHVKTVVRLAKHLDALTTPRARAAIIWLVGEYAAGPDTADVAADVWRILLKNFASEADSVQMQIILLAARVYLHHKRAEQASIAGQPTIKDKLEDSDDRVMLMLQHTFLLARYAHSFRLRDRARFLKALLLDAPSTDLAALLLLNAKPSSEGTGHVKAAKQDKAAIGTAGWLLGVDIRGMVQVPPWSTKDVGAAERSGGNDAAAQTSGGLLSRGLGPGSGSRTPDSSIGAQKSNGVSKPGKTLDQWLDEEPVDDESEEEDSSEEETGDESEAESESEEETDSDEEEEDEQHHLIHA